MTTVTPSPTFMKRLAANEKSTRDAAVSNLRTYLRARNDFSDVELLKLWKGLFYCMWMSDKPRNQQQLARDLADLIDVVSPGTVVGFADAFWKTMAREWNGIGRLRMDKYMYLVRQFLYTSLRYLARTGWTDTKLLGELTETISGTPMNTRDLKVPNGLRYHLLDIYLDEVEKVDDEHEADIPAKELLAPVVALRKECPTKSIRMQARQVMEDERVRRWLSLQKEGGQSESTDGEGQQSGGRTPDWGGFDD